MSLARVALLLLLSLSAVVSAWGQGTLINGNRTVAGAFNYCLTGGAVNAYTCPLNPAITAYQEGQCFLVRATLANTGAATLNVNSIGPIPLKKWVSGVLGDLAANDIGAGQEFQTCYDTVVMQVLSLGGGAVTGGPGTITAVGSCPGPTCFTAATPSTQLFLGFSATPAVPAAGQVVLYSDSVTQRVHDRNALGAIGTTVVADPGVANNFLTGISTAGLITKAQPGFSQLSGALSTTQTPAYTGDVTKPAGSGVQTLAAVNPDVGTFVSPGSITADAKGRITAIQAGPGGADCTLKISNPSGVNGQALTVSTSIVTVLAANATRCEAIISNNSPTQPIRCRGPEDTAAVSSTAGFPLGPQMVLRMGSESRTGLNCTRDAAATGDAVVNVWDLRP